MINTEHAPSAGLTMPAHCSLIEPEEAVYLDGGIDAGVVAVTALSVYGAWCLYVNGRTYLEENPEVSEKIQQVASSALRIFAVAFTTVAVVKLSYEIIVSTARNK
jgi:hypothetical protein